MPIAAPGPKPAINHPAGVRLLFYGQGGLTLIDPWPKLEPVARSHFLTVKNDDKSR